MIIGLRSLKTQKKESLIVRYY